MPLQMSPMIMVFQITVLGFGNLSNTWRATSGFRCLKRVLSRVRIVVVLLRNLFLGMLFSSGEMGDKRWEEDEHGDGGGGGEEACRWPERAEMVAMVARRGK
ncbi:hypothetical protein Drorol1_Dr00021066 [Drosera rotundifolia]